MSASQPFALLALLSLVLILFANSCAAKRFVDRDNSPEGRKERLLSVFNVVRFSNTACNATTGRTGTCYTADECTNNGGTASGATCAQGFGVCCIFTKTCGQMSSDNCTYFEVSSTAAMASGMIRQCDLKICKQDTNICQLRLDFEQFVISGPSTETAVVASLVNGLPNTKSAKDVSAVTQCNTDTFMVSSPGGVGSPEVCGTLNGEHMYIPASDSCNSLMFQFGASGNGAPIATRNVRIKVTQYSCDYNNLAPDGCLQYFFGSTTGMVMSFNFDNGHHLANQRQTMCIRREVGNCRVCFSTEQAIDFIVSGSAAILMGFNNPAVCCAYGANGQATTGYDCVMIPAAEDKAGAALPNSRYCGRSKGLGVAIAAMTVCTARQPFRVSFITDAYEFAAENPAGNIKGGLQLQYTMDSVMCN